MFINDDLSVTFGSSLNRPVYSGQRFRCRLRNSPRSNSAGSGRSTFTLRLTTVRLGLSKKAPLSLGMADTACFSAIPHQVREQACPRAPHWDAKELSESANPREPSGSTSGLSW